MVSQIEEWSKAKNILCVRLDSLGDVLMTTPGIRALKEYSLERRVTLLASQSGAKVSALIPEVDQTIIYDPPWMKASAPPTDSQLEFQMIDQLKQHQFDAAVIFTTFSQSPLPAALFTFMADIPLRLAQCREKPYHLLTHWVPETDHFNQLVIRHEVRRQLDLVASVGCTTANERLSLQVPAGTLESVRKLLAHARLNEDKPWLVIHPGASAASRRYPPENFAKVAEELNSVYGFQILFTGTQPEISLVETIRSSMRVNSFSLAGALDLKDFSALISMAPLLITNNTGPAHIAAALNTPVVDLYALTNPAHTPWNVPHRTLSHDVPCKFCYKSVCPLEHHDCLRLVTPVSVVEAAIDLLEEVRGFRHSGIRKSLDIQDAVSQRGT